jgi:hypothetical protein
MCNLLREINVGCGSMNVFKAANGQTFSGMGGKNNARLIKLERQEKWEIDKRGTIRRHGSKIMS